MSTGLRIFTIVCGLILIASALHNIVKQRLTEKQSLFWIFSGVVIILFGLLPTMTFVIADFFGVDYAPSIIFMLAIVLSLYGIYYCYRQIATLNRHVKELAMQVSLLNHENMLLTGKLEHIGVKTEEDIAAADDAPINDAGVGA